MDDPPSNAELSQAVSGVLTACQHFRNLFNRATPRQRDAVMAGFVWHKSVLGLHEIKAWVETSVAELAALKEERQAKPDARNNLRAAG